MNNEKKQEIPSVAFIPQGYHAVIEGNKVIIKKGEDPVSNDLEEFAKRESELFGEREYEIDFIDRNALTKGYYWGVKAGAQWQKKQDQLTIELAEDHAMLAGMEKMKEEMIDKVCKWLTKHWRKYVWLTDNDVIHFGHWEYDLKRVMEE